MTDARRLSRNYPYTYPPINKQLHDQPELITINATGLYLSGLEEFLINLLEEYTDTHQ